MLNRNNFQEILDAAARLQASPNFQVSRALRRFLSDLCFPNEGNPQACEVYQNFALGEGFSSPQLKALANFAEVVSERNKRVFSSLGIDVDVRPILYKETTGLVSGYYVFPTQPERATLSELQTMVVAVGEIAASMSPAGKVINTYVLKDCPLYQYRGLPCSIADDAKLWCVSGEDMMGGSGVLEWCYDEEDAKGVYLQMSEFPLRFRKLVAHAFLTQSPAVEANPA